MDENLKKSDDELLFAQEDQLEPETQTPREYWKILIVDDEEEVHSVTRMVLGDVVFRGKGIEFLHAYSGDETIRLITENNDTAIILLDVVMEDDDSGLRVIRYIREILKNSIVRIVIRTGQPGEAPEKKVIVDYDINDYREKTELTSQKLFSTVIASLRSFESLITIDKNRRGLEKIITSSAKLIDVQRLDKFATVVLDEIIGYFSGFTGKSGGFSGYIAEISNGEPNLMAITGSGTVDERGEFELDRVRSSIESIKLEKTFFKLEENRYTGYFKGKNGIEHVIVIESESGFLQSDKDHVEILTSIIASIYENVLLTKEIEDTQKEILFTLGEVVETRSHETGNHVRRVAEYSRLLALKYGLSESEAELIKQASPMHDVGKVGILDRILSKPDRLTEEEFEEIKTHTTRGYNIFKGSTRMLLKTAAVIALEHHERWDGSGYPGGITGEKIHIFGRITCLADIFDALGSDRVYKKAWKLEEILQYIKSERGKIFDPRLIDIFFENLDEILEIRKSFLDPKEAK